MNRIRKQLQMLMAEPDALAVVILALLLGIGAEENSDRRANFVMPCATAIEQEVSREMEIAPSGIGPVAVESPLEGKPPDLQL